MGAASARPRWEDRAIGVLSIGVFGRPFVLFLDGSSRHHLRAAIAGEACASRGVAERTLPAARAA